MNPHVEEDPDDDHSKRSYSPDPTEDPYERLFYGRRKVIRPTLAVSPRSIAEEEEARMRISQYSAEYIFGSPPPPKQGHFRRRIQTFGNRLRNSFRRREHSEANIQESPREQTASGHFLSRSPIEQIRRRIRDAFRRNRPPEPLSPIEEEEQGRAVFEFDVQKIPGDESATSPPVSRQSRIQRFGKRIAGAFRRRRSPSQPAAAQPQPAEEAISLKDISHLRPQLSIVERLKAKIEELQDLVHECNVSLHETVEKLQSSADFAASQQEQYNQKQKDAIQDEAAYLWPYMNKAGDRIQRLQAELDSMEVNDENIEIVKAQLEILEAKCSRLVTHIEFLKHDMSELRSADPLQFRLSL